MGDRALSRSSCRGKESYNDDDPSAKREELATTDTKALELLCFHASSDVHTVRCKRPLHIGRGPSDGAIVATGMEDEMASGHDPVP